MNNKQLTNSKRQWTNEEDEFLRDNVEVMTGQEIADALNRTRRSVYNRAQVLFLSFNKKATYQLYEMGERVFSGTVEECAEFWGVKKSTIQFYATKEHAKRVDKSANPEKSTSGGENVSEVEVLPGQTDIYEYLPNEQRFWTNEEDEFLRDNIDTMSAQEIAYALNRTRTSVYNRAQTLFLKFRKEAIYQLYEKDMPVFCGNAEECARFWGVEKKTIYYYATKTHAKRNEESGRPEKRRIAVRL